MADSFGGRAKGHTAMENCLQKNPDINVVYTINEPAAAGAFNTLKKAGKERNVLIVSVDGGCDGIKDVAGGRIAATSPQYPLKMGAMGVEAGVAHATAGTKVKPGHTDTGVTLIAARPIAGVLRNGLTLMGVSSVCQVLITGILVLLAVTVDQPSRKGGR